MLIFLERETPSNLMAVSKQPTITLETSGTDEEISSRGEAKWKRFHPFRVVRKIFRRRIKREGASVSDASKKSWSTSELQSVQDDGTGKREVTPLKIGLSVSHDSIFSPDTSTAAVSSHISSLSVHHTTINMFKDELFTRVRARKDSCDDDDDVEDELLQSPCASPTHVDDLTQDFKEKSPKNRTCSAASLISMRSTENDEISGISSGHSSKMSVTDRRSLDSDDDTDPNQHFPLNHKAAHHKISVRPKRTYGLPRRRMNQIAASKLSTLPSTLELIEDSGRSFEKHEVVKTFRELSESSRNEFSSEWQVSQMVSSISLTELPDIPSDFLGNAERSLTSKSNSQICNEIIKENSENFDDENVKPLQNIDTVIPEVKETVSQIFSSTKSSYGFSRKICKDAEAEICESFKTENKERTIPEINESFTKENEISLKVSSLVKNLEKSESVKKTEKLFIDKEEEKMVLSQNSDNKQVPELTFVQTKSNEICLENREIIKSDLMKENIFPKIHLEKSNECASIENEFEIKTQSQHKFVKEVRLSNIPSKLDVDSEFIMKRDVNKDKKVDLSFKETVGNKENSLISSFYLEEESLLNSKSLSVGVEESGIFVSHHASYKSDRIVTEAHNFAEMFIQSSGDILKSNDSCVSSLDIPTSVSINSDVTVNSSTSTLCTNKIIDKKITISVNSNSEAIEYVTSPLEQDETKQSIVEFKNAELSLKQDVNTQSKLTEKQADYKSQRLESNSSSVGMKNISAQKSVSVEIVPFTQRMKERKYHPVSFGNKDHSSEENEKNATSPIERMLSDRTVATKNKESDKANNRHSFSGALVLNNKKTDPEFEKKAEKVQYPVQIRIHKSVTKPEIKDNLTAADKRQDSTNTAVYSDGKSQAQGSKIQNETKAMNEYKNIQDSSTKWEVKIQPSILPSNNTNKSQIVEDNASSSLLSSEVSSETGNEIDLSPVMQSEIKVSQIHQELTLSELPPSKNNDNSRKNVKEVPLPLSDDPEPELLRVFARRSIKQKNCDKSKTEEPKESCIGVSSLTEKTEDSNEINISESTVVNLFEIPKQHIKTHDIKKKSKSFCEKEKVFPRSVSPLKEMNLIHRESLVKLTSNSSVTDETIHPRQRLASVPDIPLSLPPESVKIFPKESACSPAPSDKAETQQRTKSTSTTASINASLGQETMNEKEPLAPSWLQLAQQRRELREQRERLLLGGSPNSFMDGSNKPSRSSKVWDMVNNFQKLQMT